MSLGLASSAVCDAAAANVGDDADTFAPLPSTNLDHGMFRISDVDAPQVYTA